MILPQKFYRNKLRNFNILIYGIIYLMLVLRTVGWRILIVKLSVLWVFILISLSVFFFFLFKAKAKEKKEAKAGERDDTIPPEYRLTPALVSFSCLHCFLTRALRLTLSFVTGRGRTWGKQANIVFNQQVSPVGDFCISSFLPSLCGHGWVFQAFWAKFWSSQVTHFFSKSVVTCFWY